MTDQDLLQAYAQRRDVRSLEAFVRRHQDQVVRFVTGLVGDGDAAQDVAQETFLAVARHPRRLLKVSSCRSWLLKVARNRSVDHLRREARRRRHTQLAAEANGSGTCPGGSACEPGPAAALEGKEREARVRAEIRALSPRHRELLLLRVQEGLSYKEIAEVTGLSATNVGYILHQAVKALGSRLKDLQ